MHRCRSLLLIALAAVAAFAPAECSAQHYNFGMFKRSVTLQRRLLPGVELGNISLSVVFPRGAAGLDTGAFTSELETLIAQNGATIRLVTRDPQYEIRCYPTEVQRPHIVAKTENKISTRSASGNITMDAQLVHASDGAVVLAFTESAALNASSTANANTPGSGLGLKLPSINLPGFHKSQPASEASAPVAEPLADSDTDATLNSRLLRSLALHVASHMTPMNETIPILLAGGGALDDADKLAQNNRWTEYLEAVKGVTPSSAPADDAYRLYDIGVANEALGYAASSPKSALKFLNEASAQYTKAAEDKRDEKYFVPPQKRIEVAIVRYDTLVDREKTATKAPAAATAAESGPRSGQFTNLDVLKLVQANVPKDVIAAKINSTPDEQFDLSTDGIIALSKGGVPSDIIALMNRRMSSSQPASSSVHRPR